MLDAWTANFESSAFPDAIPGDYTECDFISMDDGMQALVYHADAEIVADITSAEDTNTSNSQDCEGENQLRCVIHCCCGTMERVGLSFRHKEV